MIKFKFTLILSFLVIFALQAQETINAVLLDSESKNPIGYVNVGILETIDGTVSEADGSFKIKIKDSNALVKFTSIGYHDKTITAKDLKKMKIVYLEPQAYQIETVEVVSKKYGEEKILGKYIGPTNTVWAWADSEKLGLEVGIRVKIKNKTLLKSANFALHKVSTDSLLLRVNVYDFKSGKLGKNLLPENVFVKVNSALEFLTVDLTKFNLVVEENVLLCLEIVNKRNYKEQTNIAFRVKSSMLKTNIYQRDVKHQKFNKAKGFGMVKDNVGFYFIGKEVE